jgi:hypothetical protein
MEGMKVRFSTLWVFAVLNYLYADVFSLFFSHEEVTFTEGAVLGFAVLMEG